MVLLAVRNMLDLIYKNKYPNLLKDKQNDKIYRRLISGVVTELLDPAVFYSRFSFLESGKDAIDLKIAAHKGKKGVGSGGRGAFYQRSALNKSLIPKPSEGKIRTRFCEY